MTLLHQHFPWSVAKTGILRVTNDVWVLNNTVSRGKRVGENVSSNGTSCNNSQQVVSMDTVRIMFA